MGDVRRYVCLANGVMQEAGDNPKHFRLWVMNDDHEKVLQQIASLTQSLNAMDRINDRIMAVALRAEQAETKLATLQHAAAAMRAALEQAKVIIGAWANGIPVHSTHTITWQREVEQALAAAERGLGKP